MIEENEEVSMQYVKRNQLTVLQLANSVENISMDLLKTVLIEQPSDMIYCESEGKLIGIISTGDILKAYRKRQDRVSLNKNFTFLRSRQYMRARAVFLEKEFINAVPIVTGNHVLTGEYTRWDDLIFLEYEFNAGRFCAGDWDVSQTIALVRPGSVHPVKKQLFDTFKEHLVLRGVAVRCIEHSQVLQYLDLVDMVLFVDEKELRACDTVLKILLGEYHRGRSRLNTYKSILWNADYCDEQYAAYLVSLQNQGVHVLGLTFDERVYYECLEKKFHDKYTSIGEEADNMVPKSMYKNFFDDLFSNEYAEQILNIPFENVNDKGVFKLKDCNSQYYNVAGGERWTVRQPEKYERTIYFFGPCFIYGHYVEDKNTIESFLQERLSGELSATRVVNCGCMGMYTGYMCLPRIAITQLRKGDIVVIGRAQERIHQIDYLDLNWLVAENNVDVKWMVNSPMHCNHKVYQLYADAIYKTLEPVLNETIKGQGELIKQNKDYMKLLYLDQYFSGFDLSKYEKIGAIVMNCNPFTYGHRYLIERALDMVDFLIIFVVQEEKSIFSFVERFVMVCSGVADLENVKVVPSGPFILSQMSFPEYFVKSSSRDIVEHTEQDVVTFAACIAPRLGIRYRFVGEEPEDGVTKQYNLAMKKILPQYGIELIEISRRKVRGKHISASAVRRYMEKNDTARLNELLPETTRLILGFNRNKTQG